MNNDWLKGYRAALDNILDATEAFQKDAEAFKEEMDDNRKDDVCAYNTVINYIKSVKSSYRTLIAQLNEDEK